MVAPDGSKRRLGGYDEAAWSPHGLYVIAATSNELAALEPGNGTVHWSMARPKVAFPRWGGSRTDTRVAYLSGMELRIVGRRRNGRRRVAAAAHIAPAWRPGSRQQLAFVTSSGQVRLLGAWRSSHRYAEPRALVWSPDGKALALVTARQLVLFNPGSGRARTLDLRGVSVAAFSSRRGLAVLEA